MKIFCTIIFLSISTFVFSQKKTFKVDENNEVRVESLKYTLDSLEELKKINWDDVKEMFETNKLNQDIELSFEVALPKSKNLTKYSFKSGGKQKDIEDLIKNMKKGVRIINKIMDSK